MFLQKDKSDTLTTIDSSSSDDPEVARAKKAKYGEVVS